MGTIRPSALDTTFWVMTTTSPGCRVGPTVRRGASASATITGQVGSRLDLADAGQWDEGDPAQPRASITSRASAAARSGVSMMVGATSAAHAFGLDGGRLRTVGFVHHEGADPGGVEAGHADDRWLGPQLGSSAGRPDPSAPRRR